MTPCATWQWPTSALGKYLQGLHFFGRQAGDPEEFVVAVQWWLGGTIKLAIVPPLWLLIPEICMRFTFDINVSTIASKYIFQAMDS